MKFETKPVFRVIDGSSHPVVVGIYLNLVQIGKSSCLFYSGRSSVSFKGRGITYGTCIDFSGMDDRRDGFARAIITEVEKNFQSGLKNQFFEYYLGKDFEEMIVRGIVPNYFVESPSFNLALGRGRNSSVFLSRVDTRAIDLSLKEMGTSLREIETRSGHR